MLLLKTGAKCKIEKTVRIVILKAKEYEQNNKVERQLYVREKTSHDLAKIVHIPSIVYHNAKITALKSETKYLWLYVGNSSPC